jgi:hypothetical protein
MDAHGVPAAAMKRIAAGGISPLVLLLFLLVMVGATPEMSAQTSRSGPARGGWLPRQDRLPAELTAAQRAEAIATLDRIERIMRQVPELASPEGFEILPILSGGSRQTGPDDKPLANSVIDYALSLMFFHPSRAIAGEGSSAITVRVNATQQGRMKDSQGRAIYIEEARAMEPRGTPREIAGTLWQIPSATQVYGELWDFTRDIREGRGERSGLTALFVDPRELPWVPVSRETFYEATRIEQQGSDGRKLDEFRAALAKTPYEQWMAEAPTRKQSRDEALAAARQFQTPADVEKMRKVLEDTDRQVTEQLRKQEADDRDRNRDNLNKLDAREGALRRELERMTPEERAMPTYINNALQEGPRATGWTLTTDPSPPAWRVLSPNDDFWRARRSPVEVRSITVHIGIGGTGLRPKVRQALLQTFRTLDWPAFRQLLDAPR